MPGAPRARLAGLGWWSRLPLCVNLFVIGSVPHLRSGSGQRSLLAWPEQLSPPSHRPVRPGREGGAGGRCSAGTSFSSVITGRAGGRAWRHRPPRTPARLNCVHLTTSCDLHSPAVDGRVRTGARGRSGSAPNLAASSPHWGAVSKRLLSPGLFLAHAIMGLSLRDVLHPQAPQPGPAGRRTPKPLTLMKGHRGVGWAETAGSVRFPGKWHVNP